MKTPWTVTFPLILFPFQLFFSFRTQDKIRVNLQNIICKIIVFRLEPKSQSWLHLINCTALVSGEQTNCGFSRKNCNNSAVLNSAIELKRRYVLRSHSDINGVYNGLTIHSYSSSLEFYSSLYPQCCIAATFYWLFKVVNRFRILENIITILTWTPLQHPYCS